MKAVIMAGGDGRRLRPLTCTKPKPLIPLLNRPILDYTMDLLAKHNINEAVFTLHYLGDMIKKHIGDDFCYYDLKVFNICPECKAKKENC